MALLISGEQVASPSGVVIAAATTAGSTASALAPAISSGALVQGVVATVAASAIAPSVTASGRALATVATASATALPPIITGDLVVDQVGWIGDSLTYQDGTGQANIKSLLVANGWPNTTGTRVDGLIGRSIINGVAPYIPSSQDVVNTWRAGGFNPRTWVIALITNDEWDTDANWTTKVNTLLNLIVSVPHASGLPYRVYWVGGPIYRADVAAANAPTYDNRATRFAAVMASIRNSRLAAGQIGEMTYINFPVLFRNGRDETGLWQTGDATGRHMTQPGYAVRNNLTAPLVLLPSGGLFPGATTFPSSATFPDGPIPG